MTMWLWSDNLKAQWGLIDDHEIMETLGPAGKLGFSEIPKRLMATEAAIPGVSLRYRPTYASLRLIEAWLWGANPHLWYIARMLMFALSLAIVWWLAAQALGLTLATGFTLYLLTYPYWPAIWACLGPGETYTCVGAALAALGFYLLCAKAENGPRYVISWILVDLGVILAAGSKENFVVFAFPLAWLLVREWRAKRLNFDLGIAGALTLAYCVFIAGAVVLALSRKGVDIYANTVTVQERASLLGKIFASSPTFSLVVLLASAAFLASRFAMAAASSERAMALRGLLQQFAITEVTLGLFYAVQVVFYDGGWPHESRYAFPGDTISLFGCLFVPVYFVLQCRQFMPALAANRIAVYPGVILIIMSWLRGYDVSLTYARDNAKRTSEFSTAIYNVEQAAGKDPNMPIVLWSHSLSDYEAIYSVKSFVRARGMNNPVLLQTPPEYPRAGFTPQLAAALFKDIDRTKAGELGFAKPEVLEKATSCVIIGFSQEPPPGKCKSAGHIAH